MARCAHFRVAGRFDGTTVATITIEETFGVTFFRVRPFRRRKTFELLLADVARGVIYDVTKRELAERRRTRGRR
jgi:hypothetical protein